MSDTARVIYFGAFFSGDKWIPGTFVGELDTNRSRRIQEAENSLQGSYSGGNLEVSLVMAPTEVSWFHLQFQELIDREKGMYNRHLYLSVGNFYRILRLNTGFSIKDVQPLTFVRKSRLLKEQLRYGEYPIQNLNKRASIERTSETAARVTYRANDTVSGLYASLAMAIEFDVRRFRGGEIFAQGDNFVHTITPDLVGDEFYLMGRYLYIYLSNLTVRYGSQVVDDTSLSTTSLGAVRNGSEALVCGKLVDATETSVAYEIRGRSRRRHGRLFSAENATVCRPADPFPLVAPAICDHVKHHQQRDGRS